MAQPQQHTPIEQVLELLTEQGSEGFAEALRLLLNLAMLFEREHFLQAAPYERTSERRDYANGFKAKHLRTRLGELDLRIPQVRSSEFYPSALERGTRSERVLLAAMVKKYTETSPRLSVWMEANVYQGLTVMSFPVEHQKRLRTTNLNERINRELKRRTRVVGVFPNAASLERLATAVLMEIDEDWQSGTRYLTFS